MHLLHCLWVCRREHSALTTLCVLEYRLYFCTIAHFGPRNIPTICSPVSPNQLPTTDATRFYLHRKHLHTLMSLLPSQTPSEDSAGTAAGGSSEKTHWGDFSQTDRNLPLSAYLNGELVLRVTLGMGWWGCGACPEDVRQLLVVMVKSSNYCRVNLG